MPFIIFNVMVFDTPLIRDLESLCFNTMNILPFPSIFCVLFACIGIQKVISQCTDRINDGFGYHNVKELDSVNGFLPWSLVYGDSTANGVGPTAGYNGQENDCYFLTGGGATGDRALILSPCYAQLTDPVEVNFAYYAFGENAGNLTVYLRPGCLKHTDLPTEQSNSGLGHGIVTVVGASQSTNQWQTGQGVLQRRIPTEYSPFQIIFEGTVKGETNNSMAVDNISVNNAVNFTTAAVTSPAQPTTPATGSQRSNMKTMPSSPSVATAMDPAGSSPSPDGTTMVATTDGSTETSGGSTYVVSTSDGETTKPSPSISMGTLMFTWSTGANDSTPETNTTMRPTTWCDENLVIPGIDNCTFIGLMFAICPLGFIFILWLVCCTYNRYCRKPEEPGDRYPYNHGDGESSMAKDPYASTSVGAGGYYTDSSFAASIPPSTNPTTDNTTENGAAKAVDESHELVVLSESKEEDCLVDIGGDDNDATNTPADATKAVGNDYEYSIRRKDPDDKAADVADDYDTIAQQGGNGMNGAAVIISDKDVSSQPQDPPYDVLDGSGESGGAVQVPDNPVLDVSGGSQDPPYDVLDGSGENAAAVQVPPENSIPDVSGRSQDPPYAVLDGPGSPDSAVPEDMPIPPKRTTSVMAQPRNNKHDEERLLADYETIPENNSSLFKADPPPNGQSKDHVNEGSEANFGYATLDEATVVAEDGSEDTKL